jgi:hypothetical protein
MRTGARQWICRNDVACRWVDYNASILPEEDLIRPTFLIHTARYLLRISKCIKYRFRRSASTLSIVAYSPVNAVGRKALYLRAILGDMPSLSAAAPSSPPMTVLPRAQSEQHRMKRQERKG